MVYLLNMEKILDLEYRTNISDPHRKLAGYDIDMFSSKIQFSL